MHISLFFCVQCVSLVAAPLTTCRPPAVCLPSHILRGEELQAEERRKKEIEDSKYLGGDIKHTHLVKGLDFALLQRTRDEVVDTSDDIPAEEEPAAPTEDVEMTVRVGASLSLGA